MTRLEAVVIPLSVLVMNFLMVVKRPSDTDRHYMPMLKLLSSVDVEVSVPLRNPAGAVLCLWANQAFDRHTSSETVTVWATVAMHRVRPTATFNIARSLRCSDRTPHRVSLTNPS